MAFFYLTPAKGEMPMHLLETIVANRVEYLKTIFRGDSVAFNEYVVDGSIYDNVGHFTLCIMTILSNSNGITQFILKAEGKLFKQRIASLSVYNMRCFARKLLRAVNKHSYLPNFLDPLQVLCQHLMIKDIAQHLCPVHTVHNVACTHNTISLPFKQCLHLIAKRQVELCNGKVALPCSRWLQYLSHLFNTNLSYRIRHTDLEPLRRDPRLKEMLSKLNTQLLPFTTSLKSDLLLSKDVNNSSKYFPPCMLNLHQTLRQKHRLSHNQRFYYSLFLKDIGMPVEEAIEFWRGEYRLSPNGTHTCCHNWDKDEKKFLYGIRHMYGLEGARKNYTSVNCIRIQNDISCSEGGCPFKSFDLQKMVKVLNCNNDLLSQIKALKSRRQYTSACILHLKNSAQNVCDNVSFSFTPVKYYSLATKSDLGDE